MSCAKDTKADPATWPVIIYEPRLSAWHRYDMPATTFLRDLVTHPVANQQAQPHRRHVPSPSSYPKPRRRPCGPARPGCPARTAHPITVGSVGATVVSEYGYRGRDLPMRWKVHDERAIYTSPWVG